jgi:hypothetical protein
MKTVESCPCVQLSNVPERHVEADPAFSDLSTAMKTRESCPYIQLVKHCAIKPRESCPCVQ